jgi:aryl carrier-like protein
MVHNAMERVRRETLNTKFQELAYALPTLRTVRRPSKSQIVQRALEFVRSAFIQERLYQKQITTLKRENELLIAQLDSIRNKLSNQLNAEVFGVHMKKGDADFILDDNPPLQQQHAEDEDDRSTESWEFDALGLGEQHGFSILYLSSRSCSFLFLPNRVICYSQPISLFVVFDEYRRFSKIEYTTALYIIRSCRAVVI